MNERCVDLTVMWKKKRNEVKLNEETMIEIRKYAFESMYE